MIIRTYRCNDCGDAFEVTLDSGDAGDPDCPYCAQVLQWQPTSFSIKTNRSRALDITQEIVEQDYGLSDMKDGLREGDIAAKTPIRSRAEREAIEKLENDARQLAQNANNLSPAAQNFFGGGQKTGLNPMNLDVKSVLQNAKGSVPADRNPMDMLAKAGRKGELPVNYRLLTEHGRTITVRK